MVTLERQPVGCFTEVACLYSGTCIWWSPLRHNQLAVIQRWSVYTVEPVYSGHPWDTTSWLLYRGGLLIQWNLYIVVTLETQPVGCYTEVVCLYSGTCIEWSPLRHNQLAVIQRWPAYTVEPVYSGHPWDTTSWLLYRGGLLIQWNLYIVVTLGTQPVGCYTEVACLYSVTCI